MTREELENRDNWQATFQLTREPLQFDCLMRCSSYEGYYWHQPNHQGIAYGATMYYRQSHLADALKRGILQLVSGTLPEGV